MRNSFIAIAATASFALASTGARADVTAYTSVTHLTVTLTDLDTTDGIMPSLVFTGFSGNTLVAAESSTNPDSFQEQAVTLTSLPGPATVHASGPFNQADGAIGGNVSAGTGSIVLSSSGTGFPQFSTAGADFSVGTGTATANFTLSAQTSLTISADYEVYADTGLNADMFALSESGVFFTLSGAGGDGLSAQTSSYGDYSVAGAHPLRENNTGSFAITFSNPTGNDAAGSLQVFVRADVDTGIGTNPPNVPEPTTGALLLAGLGAVGLVRRRRPRREA